MKKIITLLAFIGIATLLKAQIQQDGLINHFTFNNTLMGSIGSNTISGLTANYANDRNNASAKALNVNSSINASTNAGITGLPVGNNSRTIAFWYKSNSSSIHSFFNYGTGSAHFAMAFLPSTSQLVVSNGVGEFGVSRTYSANWAHIAATTNNGTLTIYVNGVVAGTTTMNFNIPANPTSRIGNSPGNAYFGSFNIDDLLIYNRALNANEIRNIFFGVSLNKPINTTPTSNLTICQGQSTTLTVSGVKTIKWFNVSSGGVHLDTGNTFITPSLNRDTTFYVKSDSAGFISERTAIKVTVLPVTPVSNPTIVADTSIIYCEGTQLTLKVAGTGNNYRWYNVPTGGAVLGVGHTFITPSLINTSGSGQISTITYYAESFNACANPSTSARTAVVLKIGTPSFNFTNTSAAGSYYACSGSSATFSITTNATSIQWLSNGNIMGTNNVFTTPLLTSDSTYTARLSNSNGCVAIISFPVKVYTKQNTPPTNLTPNISVCPGDSITLRASTTFGVPLNWQTNAGFLGIGDSIRVAASNDGLYYVRTGTSVGCYSAVTNVQLNVTPTPLATINLSGSTISSSNLFDSYTLFRNGVQVAQSSSSGSFTFNNATCGSYQAVFSNTVNSCPAEIDMFMRRQNVSTGCDNIIITQPNGITFPATVQARKGGGTFTAPIQLTGFTTILSNICTVPGGNNNTEVRIVGANGCTYLFVQNTNSITTSSTATIKYANYVEGDLLTPCPIRSNVININITNPSNTTPTNNRSACFGKTTTLTASGNGTLTWFNQATGGLPIGTGTSLVTPTITATTTYYVEASSGTCKSERTPIIVSLNPLPVLAMDRSIDTTICEGETVFLNVTFNNPINVQWIPAVGPGLDVKPITTTTYNVNVSNTQGCTASSSITIVVKPRSATPINQSLCFGDSILFKGQTIKQSGVYRDTLTNSLGCDSIVTLNLIINPLPSPTVTQNGQELSTQNFSAYQWKLNNNNITGANDRTFTPVVNGNYSVEVSDNNTCKNISVPFVVSSVGLLNLSQLNIGIFPNPAKEQFNISHIPSKTKIQLLSIEGKVLLTKWSENGTEVIETKDLLPGLYLVSLEIETQLYLSKIQVIQ